MTSKNVITKKKTPKKTYTLAGQKFDPPEEREPLRIFYESLSKQIPSSEMAEFWSRMMEHGLLSPEKAKKAYEKKQRQKQMRSSTPVKPTFSSKSENWKHGGIQKLQPMKDVESKAKKRLPYSDDDDDEFLIKRKKKM